MNYWYFFGKIYLAEENGSYYLRDYSKPFFVEVTQITKELFDSAINFINERNQI